ncbi:MAG: hypothetical protein IKS63_03630 [Firmicutes bacterium]|nr:hypothetical protein [Bacillota bacterium]
MFGYVRADNSQLKMYEYELYTGYYCGICKSIGNRFGQIPRLVLSYDAAFLAMLLEALSDTPDDPVAERCITHHIKKKTVIRNSAIDYAADIMLILAWHNLLDDAKDEGKVYAKAITTLMRRKYEKLLKERPQLCFDIEGHLFEMNELEKAKCANLDQVAECFARIMQAVALGYGTDNLPPGTDKVLSRLGYHLGKWIYLIDAVDDIEKDMKSGAYNPLFYRFGLGAEETAEEFRSRTEADCRRNLLTYLEEIAKCYDLLDIKKNKGILENIIFIGLMDQTDKALRKKADPSAD